MLSLLIPCRNEAGNIKTIFLEMNKLHNIAEIIFIEGGSSDSTFATIQDQINRTEQNNVTLIKQKGAGKFNAVIEGAALAKSEHLAIWDADLTIDATDQNLLIDLYLNVMETELFVTANRLNPQRHDSAMRQFNLYGNHFFSFATKTIIGINVPDVLAGTKIFPKKLISGDNICEISMNLDPFGDLFLIARARYFNLQFKAINCEYRARSYGETNIPRWRGGYRMFLFLLHLIKHKCHLNTIGENNNSRS